MTTKIGNFIIILNSNKSTGYYWYANKIYRLKDIDLFKNATFSIAHSLDKTVRNHTKLCLNF